MTCLPCCASSSTPFCGPNARAALATTIVALAALTALVGLFISLSAQPVLPKTVTFAMMAVGCVTLALSAVPFIHSLRVCTKLSFEPVTIEDEEETVMHTSTVLPFDSFTDIEKELKLVSRGGFWNVYSKGKADPFVYKEYITLKPDGKTRKIKEGTYERYLERYEEAKGICRDQGLERIYLPRTSLCYCGSTTLIKQTKIPSGLFRFGQQESCFQNELNNNRVEMKELFKELLIFTCRMNMADLKYDNLPLVRHDGMLKVALIDLDRRGAFKGLTKSLAKSEKYGFFHIIPAAWFDEFIVLAGQHLKLTAAQIQTIHDFDTADNLKL